MKRLILTDARIIGPSDDFNGTVVVEDDIILEVIEGKKYSEGINMRGSWLCPGIIDIHSDYIEREFSPRPNTGFPSGMAFRHLDMRALTSGITTLFTGISFRENPHKDRSIALALHIAEEFESYMNSGYFLARHFIHGRIDVTHPRILEYIDKILSFKSLKIAVYNDHTPGTRQFRDMKRYIDYTKDVSGMTETELLKIADNHIKQTDASGKILSVLSGKITASNIVIGSHDDTTLEHVDEAALHGAVFCEFPTTFEAAEHARKKGLAVAMGAPNLILGKSQSGNISCREAVDRSLADVLCSDYHFPAMLSSAVYLMENGKTPSEAVNMITFNAAKLVNMQDKTGSIKPGMKADIIAFDIVKGYPFVKNVIVDGNNVFNVQCDMSVRDRVYSG